MSRARTLADLGSQSLATDAELSAAVEPKADKVAARNVQTVSAYTLVLADSPKILEMNVATANTVTIPLDSSVNFPVGSSMTLIQVGAGQTTVAATAGVTPNATPGLKLRAQWSLAVLIKRAANTWILAGDVSA